MPHLLKNVLAGVLEADEISQLYSAFDQIGDIVIVKIPDSLLGKKELIADAILTNIKTAKSVFAQASAVKGDFRIRDLEFIAGENRTMTEYKEHGCRFSVDIAKTYFSPRLSTERQRIASLIGDNETIVNMFAGVGTYSIIIAKANKTCKVYSIDSNPIANALCIKNAMLNKVSERVIPICADATDAIRDRLTGMADRVLMPLPERAKEYICPAVEALKGKGTIHYFSHVRADSKNSAKHLGTKDAQTAFKDYDHSVIETTVVREVGPRLYQIVADVEVTPS